MNNEEINTNEEINNEVVTEEVTDTAGEETVETPVEDSTPEDVKLNEDGSVEVAPAAREDGYVEEESDVDDTFVKEDEIKTETETESE